MVASFLRWTGAAPDASVFERPGLVACLASSAPDRSIPNSVVAADPEALPRHYDDLARAYEEAGITAWTVWVPSDEPELESWLAEKGHAVDGDPAAMVLDLGRLRGLEPGDLEWDSEASPAELGELNDRAYGYTPEEGLAHVLAGAPRSSDVRLYRARVDGETASVLGTIDNGDDVGVLWVATPPEFRGRALASRLMSIALREALTRGMKTSTLQGSKMGAPIYERMGYETPFRYRLLELRR